MGRDKAFLKLGGHTLLELAVAKPRGLPANVAIVGSQAKFAAFAPVVEDEYLERGPLGAIHAALAKSTTEWNFILAVDMPFVDGAFPQWLSGEAQQNEAVVTVTRPQGRLQPLCAVYRKRF